MARQCKHCGMESDTDRVCSWCGKSLEAAAPAPTAAPPAGPGKAAAPSGPAAGGRGRHAGAARALLAADAKRRETPVWPAYLIGAGVLLVLVIGGFVFAFLRAQGPPAEPAEWISVTSQNKLLSLQVPSNWKFTTSGSTGTFERVKVFSGSCRVSLEGSQIKGAMGDIAGAAARAATGPEGNLPLTLAERAEGRLHASLGEAEKKRDPAFQDQDDLTATTFAGVPAASSHYTTRKSVGLFSVQLKGLRITAPGAGDLAYDIRLVAPAKQWDKFEPTALKIMESVTRAG
jgi:hypothetical protein